MDKIHDHSTPYRVGFLLIDGFALLSFSSVLEPLRAANQLAGKAVYEFHFFSAKGGHTQSSSGVKVETPAERHEGRGLNVLFIVAGGDPMGFQDQKTFQWLRELAHHRVTLAGVSGGPVLLARAGVMSGRRMTVHWDHAAALAELDPELFIVRTLYVIDRDRITCAGGIAPLDLMHALLTEQQGADFARRVSDWFMHTEIRPSGGPQRAGITERYRTTDPAIVAAIEAMENHIADPLTLGQLAELAGVGPRQLNRAFAAKIGRSSMAFYRDIRLDAAQTLLAQSSLSVTEIALATGFASSAHFSESYRRKFQALPSRSRG